MTEEEFQKAYSLNYEIGVRRRHIEDINNVIKSLKEKEGHNCKCEISLLGSYLIASVDLYPLTKKIVDVLVEHLTERKKKHKEEIKELEIQFKNL